MKLTVQIEINEAEQRILCQNSLERVLNTALLINQDLDAFHKHEYGSVNAEDLEELKPLASRLWYAATQAAIFLESTS